MAQLPIYKLIINDDDTDTTGVQAIALVDKPAIEMNWMAFAKQEQFKVANKEKRIISGPLMVADQLIYRKDEQLGEYNVMFDADTIYKIVQKFFRQGNIKDVNMMHDDSAKAQGVYMIESFIIDKTRGISTPKGFEKLSEGSWFGSFKVDNDQIWDEFIKTGVFKGFSVEGYFNNQKVSMSQQEYETLYNQVKNFIKTVQR